KIQQVGGPRGPCLSLSLSRAGCWAGPVTGPGSVCGPPGGSVAVQCRYETGYEEDPKFWCRAGSCIFSGQHLAETSRAEAEVKWGRVSIRDNRTERVFTVTVENLTPADAGNYYCGIVKDWIIDPTDTVTLIISPGKSRPCSQLAPGGGVSGPAGGCLVPTYRVLGLGQCGVSAAGEPGGGRRM
uniref:Ig-like domain-containing protein n=1 Tax=Pelusios castaneus TaxID=367368 RepID=A0A8C8S7N5_9SAUR